MPLLILEVVFVKVCNPIWLPHMFYALFGEKLLHLLRVTVNCLAVFFTCCKMQISDPQHTTCESFVYKTRFLGG